MKKTIRGSRAAMKSLEEDFQLSFVAADRLIGMADDNVRRKVTRYGVTVIRRGDDYSMENDAQG